MVNDPCGCRHAITRVVFLLPSYDEVYFLRLLHEGDLLRCFRNSVSVTYVSTLPSPSSSAPCISSFVQSLGTFDQMCENGTSCNILFLYQPYIPYACGMDSAGLRNAFRTHTEFIPHPMRNMWTIYHRIPESVDTPPPLLLKM